MSAQDRRPRRPQRPDLPMGRYDTLVARLYGDGPALAVLVDLSYYGLPGRVGRYTDDEIVAYCRNVADQRARRFAHDTGA